LGPPAELLARDGEYARLWRAQSAAGGEAAAEPATVDDDDPSLDTPALERRGLRLERDGDELVALERSGARRSVIPRRCFPLTDPERFVALTDARGHELACFDEPNELDGDSRRALFEALGAATFLPVIRRIEAVTPLDARFEWRVETDRGHVTFVLEQEEHVRPLENGRYVVTDSHGMRYLIEEATSLDPASRRWLGRFT
ncbi:MAG TPA: DUF1854 domain-containing protein, partial [Polyangiaceae bacterium]|nr:DUF1854 domain-containing protein [Polyangiaceae bacterium]